MTLDRTAQALADLVQQAQTVQRATASSGGRAGQTISLRANGRPLQARCLVSLPPGPVVAVLTATGWACMPASVTRLVGQRQVEFRQQRGIVPQLAGNAAVLYSVVVGTVREFWVKTAGYDALFASIPVVNLYQSFVGKKNALTKHQARTSQIRIWLLGNPPILLPGETLSGTAKFSFYVPPGTELLDITSDTLFDGDSIAPLFDAESFSIETVPVPGFGSQPVKVYSFTKSLSVSGDSRVLYSEYISLTISGTVMGYRAFMSGASFSEDTLFSGISSTIAFLPADSSALFLVNYSVSGGLDESENIVSEHTTDSLSLAFKTTAFPNGSGPSESYSFIEWTNLPGEEQYISSSSSVYQSTIYGAHGGEGTEYFSPTSISTTGDWRAPIVNYAITSSVSIPGDRCVQDFILQPDVLLDSGKLNKIELDQVVATQSASVTIAVFGESVTVPGGIDPSIYSKGLITAGANSYVFYARTETILFLEEPAVASYSGTATIESRLIDALSESESPVQATLTTQSATSGLSCTLGTATSSQIDVPSPGRGTIEGITYLPPT